VEALHEFRDSFSGDLNLVEARREAATQKSFTTRSERAARNAGDLMFAQEADRKFFRGKPSRFDAGKSVEASAWEMARQAHLVEGVDDEIAAHAVLVAHFNSVRFAVENCFGGGFLADDARAKHRVLMNLHHRFDQLRRTAGVTDAKASHRIGFGKPMQENRAFAHAGKAGDAGVLAFEREFRINFVGQDQQIVTKDHVGNLQQIRARHCAASWIRREIQHDRFASWRDDGFDRLGGDGEIIFGFARNRDWNPIGECDARRITDVTRLVINNFVARITNSAQSNIERFADANCNNDLRLRIVGDVEILLDHRGDGFAQFRKAEIRSVSRAAVFERVNGRFANVPRRDEIGFAHAERNDALLALNDVEEFADARARDFANSFRYERFRIEFCGHVYTCANPAGFREARKI
jgi:hypothetical protein